MQEYDSTLDAALYYVSLGWKIFPVYGASNPEEAKRPVLKEVPNWHHDSTSDTKQIIAWFTGTNYGIGLDCGKSGVFVLDGDRLEAVPSDLNLEHAWSLRGNPERQSWIFKQPEEETIGCSSGNWLAGEVKGDGGYVVLPPSFHSVGGNYIWLDRTGSMHPNSDVLSMLTVKPKFDSEKALFLTTGEPCKVMSGLLQHYLLLMEEARKAETGRYITMRNGVIAIASRGAEGHRGAVEAMKSLRDSFYAAYGENGSKEPLRAKWKSAISNVGSKVGERVPMPCLGEDCRMIEGIEAVPHSREEIEYLEIEINEESVFELAVQTKLKHLRIQEEAKRRHSLQALEVWNPVQSTTIANLESLSDSDDRIKDLLNFDGTCLLIAQRKTGKTTLISNVIRALLDGSALFGIYDVSKVNGTIGLFDLEMTPALLGKWLGRLPIENRDKLKIYPTRGKVGNTFSYLISNTAEFTNWLRNENISILIIDPLAPLLSTLGMDENNNSDIRRLFTLIREVASNAGIGEIILSHHAGWNANVRARGASAFEDMVDVIWRLEMKGDERLFSTLGRLGNIPSTSISLDTSTGLLELGLTEMQETLD